MKKYIREVSEGVTQITTVDERWYVKEVTNNDTNKSELSYYPSVTWISGYYPKGVTFYKWLANSLNWNETEAIKIAAGNKGSKVHQALEDLLKGIVIPMDKKYLNKTTELMEELSLEEYECLMSFITWYNRYKPITIATEMVVFNEKHSYAGTLDYVCSINNKVYIIDFKTGQNIFEEATLQLSAYAHCDYFKQPNKVLEAFDRKKIKLAILQLGYKKNKAKYKFTEINNKFKLFLHAKAIWANECEKIKPKQKDYPNELSIAKYDK